MWDLGASNQFPKNENRDDGPEPVSQREHANRFAQRDRIAVAERSDNKRLCIEIMLPES